MNSQNGCVITLLGAILFVLLFGRDAFFGWAKVLLWLSVAVGTVWIVWVTIRAGLRAFRKEIHTARSAGRAWRWQYVAYPTMIGNIIVGLIVVFIAFYEHIRIHDAFDRVPFFWIPVVLFMASYFLLQPIESFIVERRKKPADKIQQPKS